MTLYSPLVYRWCRNGGLQAADAADVGQEVFQAVACGIHDFRRDREGDTFRGWLHRITQNKLRDRARGRRDPLDDAGGDGALQHVQQRSANDEAAVAGTEPCERKILLSRALQIMQLEHEDVTWQAFWLTAVEGRAPAHVAADLGITANAVYIARSRILRRFREEFQDLVDPETIV